MLKYIKIIFLVAMVGHTKSEKPLFLLKEDTCRQGPCKGMLDWWTWGPLEPYKSMKNGNGSKLPWMKEEPQPLITG